MRRALLGHCRHPSDPERLLHATRPWTGTHRKRGGPCLTPRPPSPAGASLPPRGLGVLARELKDRWGMRAWIQAHPGSSLCL